MTKRKHELNSSDSESSSNEITDEICNDSVELWTKFNDRPITSNTHKKGRRIRFKRGYLLLNELRKSNSLCDVTLITDDGTKIPAHKTVLSNGSKFFFVLFTKYFEDKSECKIENISGATLKEVVDYLYTFEVKLPGNGVESLLFAADFLEINDLKDTICDFIFSSIDVCNCFQMHTLFDQFSCEMFVNNCHRYISKEFCKIIAEGDFVDSSLDNVIQFLSSDHIHIPYEEMVYDCVMKWVKKDIDQRRRHLPKLMRCIRFGFINLEFLKDITNEPLVLDSNECLEMVKEAIAGSSIDKGFRDWSPTKAFVFIGGVFEDQKARRDIDYFFPFCKTWRWTRVNGNQIAPKLCGAGIVEVGNEIFITGGSFVNGDASWKTYLYDAITNRIKHTITMGSARIYSSVVHVGGEIFVIGGQNTFKDTSETNYYSSTLVYDIDTRKWVKYCIPHMSTSRSGACAVVLNDLIYVIGGYSLNTGYLRSAECFNQRNECWSTISSMNYSRRGAGAAVLNNKIFVAGGFIHEGNVTRSVEYYDPKSKIWTLIANMSVPRAFGGLCADEDNECLYFFGGRCLHRSHDSIERFSIRTKDWTRLAQIITKPKHSFGLATIQRVFYEKTSFPKKKT